MQNNSFGPPEPFQGVNFFWAAGSLSLAQLQLWSSLVLENGPYLKEAHWSNHMLPTPHCGATLCTPSAVQPTTSEPTPEPVPRLLTHNYITSTPMETTTPFEHRV